MLVKVEDQIVNTSVYASFVAAPSPCGRHVLLNCWRVDYDEFPHSYGLVDDVPDAVLTASKLNIILAVAADEGKTFIDPLGKYKKLIELGC